MESDLVGKPTFELTLEPKLVPSDILEPGPAPKEGPSHSPPMIQARSKPESRPFAGGGGGGGGGAVCPKLCRAVCMFSTADL